jgi:hypothetical protein
MAGQDTLRARQQARPASELAVGPGWGLSEHFLPPFSSQPQYQQSSYSSSTACRRRACIVLHAAAGRRAVTLV